MRRAQRAEDVLMNKMVKEGSRKGVTRFGKVADKLKRPPTWAAMAGVMAVGGPRSRRAAVRGSACYLAAALAHLPIKLLVGRKHPPGSSRVARVGPITSSFPSGHAASELAFSLGAAQELPLLFVPLYAATAASEWSLLRARSHYPSDVFAGAALAVGVAAVAWKLWPTSDADEEQQPDASLESESDNRLGATFANVAPDVDIEERCSTARPRARALFLHTG